MLPDWHNYQLLVHHGDVSPKDRDSSDNKMNAAPAQTNNGSGGGQFEHADASPLKKHLTREILSLIIEEVPITSGLIHLEDAMNNIMTIHITSHHIVTSNAHSKPHLIT